MAQSRFMVGGAHESRLIHKTLYFLVFFFVPVKFFTGLNFCEEFLFYLNIIPFSNRKDIPRKDCKLLYPSYFLIQCCSKPIAVGIRCNYNLFIGIIKCKDRGLRSSFTPKMLFSVVRPNSMLLLSLVSLTLIVSHLLHWITYIVHAWPRG